MHPPHGRERASSRDRIWSWRCHRGLVLRCGCVSRPDRGLRADHRSPDGVPSRCGNRPGPCRDPGLPFHTGCGQGRSGSRIVSSGIISRFSRSLQPTRSPSSSLSPILPGFGVVAHGTTLIAAVPFVAGIFLGSAVWWIILCGSLGSVRSRLSTENLRRINQVSGILITCFGAGMLVLLLAAPGLLPITRPALRRVPCPGTGFPSCRAGLNIFSKRPTIKHVKTAERRGCTDRP